VEVLLDTSCGVLLAILDFESWPARAPYMDGSILQSSLSMLSFPCVSRHALWCLISNPCPERSVYAMYTSNSTVFRMPIMAALLSCAIRSPPVRWQMTPTPYTCPHPRVPHADRREHRGSALLDISIHVAHVWITEINTRATDGCRKTATTTPFLCIHTEAHDRSQRTPQ
jgi:hypothetical protein